MTELERFLDGLQSFSSDSNFTAMALVWLFLLAAVAMSLGVLRVLGWPPFQFQTPAINVLLSSDREYRLSRRMAAGDVSHVYQAVAQRENFVLKVSRSEPNNSLLEKESQVLAELLAHPGHSESTPEANYRDYLPWPCDSFWYGRQRVTGFRKRDGFHSAPEICVRYPQGLDGRHLAWMFNRTLEVLGYVHEQGWVHGAVLPPHLLFHTKRHGLQLIGWTHAERIGQRLLAVPVAYKSWYPTECFQKKPATGATDIYLAAKSMLLLAGGDPKAKYVPDHVPPAISNCWLRCVEELPAARPQDAWELRDEFQGILEEVYGPPQFVPLRM